MDKLVFDIECNGLLEELDRIWVLSLRGVHKTDPILTYTDHDSVHKSGDLSEGLAILSSASVLYGHNLIGYDLKALHKSCGWSPTEGTKIYDTFLLSQMCYPSQPGHGLAAWGKHFDFPKPGHEDWTQFSEEMVVRNRADVEINFRLLRLIYRRFEEQEWERAYELERRVYETFCEHSTHAFLDVPKLERTLSRVEKLMAIADKKLLSQMPLRVVNEGTLNRPLRSDKSPTENLKRWCRDADFPIDRISGPFTRISIEQPNLNSVPQIIEFLLSVGWEPDTFNYLTDIHGKLIKGPDGQPKVSSPSIKGSSFTGVPRGLKRLFTKRSVYKHRAGVLRGFNSSREEDRLKTFALTCGAQTSRMTHRGVANIPRVGTFLGSQMRDLFIAPEGYVMVGCDSAQLEARVEGHFTYKYDGGEYARFILEEDVHTASAAAFGISRNQAKTVNYALAYQCSPKKLADILDISVGEAERIHQKYWEMRPAVKALIKDLETAVLRRMGVRDRRDLDVKGDNAWIRGIDGRRLYVRSMHSLKNTLIQNAGALAVKYAYVWLADKIKEEALDARIWIVYHDEVQILCKPEQAERVRELAEQAMAEGGRYLKLKVPLVGEAKVGRSWRDTH